MKKKAFTLIELMIVIVIMGVVYILAIGKFQELGKSNGKVTLQNLKNYLIAFPKKEGIDSYENIRFLCLDDCSSCDILVDGKKLKEDDSFIGFLDSDVKSYRYDFNQGAIGIPQKVYFNKERIEKDVCFSYEISKNGIGDQVIVEYKDKVYDYSTYLGKTPVYSSMQELIDAKDSLIQEVLR